jgi:hypothetical protein
MVIETGSDLMCLECKNHFAFSYQNQINIRRAKLSKHYGVSFANYLDDYFVTDYELHCSNCQKAIDKKIVSLIKRITELLASNSKLDTLLDNLYKVWSIEGNETIKDKHSFIFTYVEQLHSDVSEVVSESEIMISQFLNNTVINDSQNMPHKFYFENIVFKVISCLEKVHVIYAFLYNVEFRTNITENKMSYLWKKLKKVDNFKSTKFYLENLQLKGNGTYYKIDERRKQFDHDKTYGSHNTFSEVLNLTVNVIDYCELIYGIIPELIQLSMNLSIGVNVIPEYRLKLYNANKLTEYDMPDFRIAEKIYSEVNLLVNKIYQAIPSQKNTNIFDDYDISCRFSEISHSLLIAEKLIDDYHNKKKKEGINGFSSVDCHSLTNSAIKRLSSVQDKIAKLICSIWSINLIEGTDLYFGDLIVIFSQHIPQDESQMNTIDKITEIINSEDFRVMRVYRDRLFHIRDDLKSYPYEDRFILNLSLVKPCISLLSDLVNVFYAIKLI